MRSLKLSWTRGVLGTGSWSGTSTLKQYFVLLKNGSKYYIKYTFLAFPVLGILGHGTPLSWTFSQLEMFGLQIVLV